jgi:hypothetical protein
MNEVAINSHCAKRVNARHSRALHHSRPKHAAVKCRVPTHACCPVLASEFQWSGGVQQSQEDSTSMDADRYVWVMIIKRRTMTMCHSAANPFMAACSAGGGLIRHPLSFSIDDDLSSTTKPHAEPRVMIPCHCSSRARVSIDHLSESFRSLSTVHPWWRLAIVRQSSQSC